MNALKIRTKMALAFGLLLLAMLVLLGVATKALFDADRRFQRFVEVAQVRADLANKLREAVDLRTIAMGNLLLVTDPSAIAEESGVLQRATEAAKNALAALSALEAASEGGVKGLIGEVESVEKDYSAVALSVTGLALSDRREEAIRAFQKEYRPLQVRMAAGSERYKAAATQAANDALEKSASEFQLQLNMLLGLGLLAAGLAFVVGALITRSLGRALGAEPADLALAMTRVAEGDLTTPVEVKDGDSTSLIASVRTMQLSLIDVVGRVRQSSQSVASSSVQIVSGNLDLSNRTSQQASSLEETSSSMEELSTTFRQTADNARHANQLARSASDVAVLGGEVVARVVHTMKEIDSSSKRITDIINVIDGIAFQTNILALNAAVEAARAGENGRGFAVVASEVRSLAGRSAAAAKDIQRLIEDSVARVSQGSSLVDQAGATMTEVVTSIHQVTTLMAEISSATTEQEAGVSMVGQAMTEMDQVTQFNAALVEEMAASATSLKEQAQEMVDTVSIFKLAKA